jgi:hypothetical protein
MVMPLEFFRQKIKPKRVELLPQGANGEHSLP